MSTVQFSQKELTTWLALSATAAQKAGDFLAEAQSRVVVTASDGRDIKLDADRRSEDQIVALLRQDSDFAILSEEAGLVETGNSNSGLRWIVDPLDGSMNYLRGVPLCCVSIALWQDEQPLLGTVYDFNRNENFTGICGVGAWLNGTPIRVNQTAERQQAVLFTGFPVGTDFSVEALSGFVEQVREYKKIRLIGSAALSLAYVAAGRGDAYFERDIKLWDVAAGIVLVQAAGGVTDQPKSLKPNSLSVYAGSPDLPKPVIAS